MIRITLEIRDARTSSLAERNAIPGVRRKPAPGNRKRGLLPDSRENSPGGSPGNPVPESPAVQFPALKPEGTIERNRLVEELAKNVPLPSNPASAEAADIEITLVLYV